MGLTTIRRSQNMGDVRGWMRLRSRRRRWGIGNMPSIAIKGGAMRSLRGKRRWQSGCRIGWRGGK